MFRSAGLLVAAFGFLGTAARADDKPETTTQYFLGESKMVTPEGRAIKTSLALVKRVLKPAENKIEEHVLSIDEKSPAKSFVVVLTVTGNKFTLTDDSKTFTGDGNLKGNAWKWTEWKSTSKL